MEPCIVKHVHIGTGMPKICIPIIETTHQDIINSFLNSKEDNFDLYELRIDYFEDLLDDQKLIDLLINIKELQIKQPIIFTFRSIKEGGNVQISDQQYYHILEIACNSHSIDIIDIEYKSNEVEKLIELVHHHKLMIILSNHNFTSTPSKEVLVTTLMKMQVMGGDILKVAVMPRNTTDVLVLLEATNDCHQSLDKPIVTMSMAGLGAVSRMVGEIFGSAITFAMIKTPSAPGQIELNRLREVLDIIHKAR